MPHISGIRLYPIVGLDGVDVPCAKVTPAGGLKFHRCCAILDAAGEVVTAERNPKLQRIRAAYDLRAQAVSMRDQDGAVAETFHLERDCGPLARWLGERLGFGVKLAWDAEHGFPDNPRFPGPTLVTTGSLKEIAAWFPGLSVVELRRRARANLEFGGALAFWEDRLFTNPGFVIRFTAGPVELEGVAPWERGEAFERDACSGASTEVPEELLQPSAVS